MPRAALQQGDRVGVNLRLVRVGRRLVSPDVGHHPEVATTRGDCWPSYRRTVIKQLTGSGGRRALVTWIVCFGLPLNYSPVVLSEEPGQLDAQVVPSGPSFENDNNLKRVRRDDYRTRSAG